MKRRGALAALGALAAGLVAGLRARRALAAGAVRVVPYAYDRVWPAAVRFLRVDRKLKIVEKDEGAGYVLFEIVDDGKTFQGALELSRTKDERRDATRLAMTIGDRPSYVADALLEKLELKLRDELGEPLPPPPAPEPPATKPAGDAGPDAPRQK